MSATRIPGENTMQYLLSNTAELSSAGRGSHQITMAQVIFVAQILGIEQMHKRTHAALQDDSESGVVCSTSSSQA